MARRAVLGVFVMVLLARCTAADSGAGDDGGLTLDAGGSPDAGPVDAGLCPELDALAVAAAHPDGTLTQANIADVLRLVGQLPMPLNNLVAIINSDTPAACQSSQVPAATCTCPQRGTVVYDVAHPGTDLVQRAIAARCTIKGRVWEGRSCQRERTLPSAVEVVENYQYSTALDGGSSATYDTQFVVRRSPTGPTLLEPRKQRIRVGDGTVTVLQDPNTPGPWSIVDRQGTWSCGSFAAASGTCQGPAAAISWVK
jgi:hypothetical protein